MNDVTRNEGDVQPTTSGRPLSPIEEMERWLESGMPRRLRRRWGWPGLPDLAGWDGGAQPRVDVIDRDDEVLVRAEAPGVDKDNLDVSVTDDAVTISGSTRQEREKEEGQYYSREIHSGAFARTVPLPGTVDSDQARATFNDGVLEVTAPKVSKAKRRRVEVQ